MPALRDDVMIPDIYEGQFRIELFHRAALAGYGSSDGLTFESLPGLEGAAEDFMQSITDAVWEFVLRNIPAAIFAEMIVEAHAGGAA